MISDNIIKVKFITDTLKEMANISYSRELERFTQYLRSKSGSTRNALSAPEYSLVASGSRFQVVAYITRQLRFQDMGVRKLYTKPLFAVLQRTRNLLQQGLHEEIKEAIRKELRQALNN
ncbi:hypothetical protein EZS27_004083 [termite gut metagenome]|uniref:Uncharacterized protein n=1 Tax=termite gut metagenome TaxID=433724 RepID=A0A5J4STD0_9ZZZZ